jgi:hypothetical protein
MRLHVVLSLPKKPVRKCAGAYLNRFVRITERVDFYIEISKKPIRFTGFMAILGATNLMAGMPWRSSIAIIGAAFGNELRADRASTNVSENTAPSF